MKKVLSSISSFLFNKPGLSLALFALMLFTGMLHAGTGYHPILSGTAFGFAGYNLREFFVNVGAWLKERAKQAEDDLKDFVKSRVEMAEQEVKDQLLK